VHIMLRARAFGSLSCRSAHRKVELTSGQSFAVPPKRPHLVTNADDDPAVFLVLQGVGEYDFVPLI
jgi:mannose-6-phosphate isomerase-like protein (cupin superfamily)